MKSIIVATIAVLLTACGTAQVKTTELTSKEIQCYDVAMHQAKTIPGKDVYHLFAADCGSKEKASAYRSGNYVKAN